MRPLRPAPRRRQGADRATGAKPRAPHRRRQLRSAELRSRRENPVARRLPPPRPSARRSIPVVNAYGTGGAFCALIQPQQQPLQIRTLRQMRVDGMVGGGAEAVEDATAAARFVQAARDFLDEQGQFHIVAA